MKNSSKQPEKQPTKLPIVVRRLVSWQALSVVIIYAALVVVNTRLHLGSVWVGTLIVSCLLLLGTILAGGFQTPRSTKQKS